MGGEKYRSVHRKSGERVRIALTSTVLVVVLVALAGAGGYVGWDRWSVPDYSGAGTGSVRVDVRADSTLTDIGVALVGAGVVKSTEAFLRAARDDPRAQRIQAGSFKLRKEMSGEAAVALLLDPAARVRSGVTIKEGRTAKEVYAILAKATGVPVGDFAKAGRDPVALGVPKSWFKRDDGQKAARSIEGFLFPDTYEFRPGATAQQMLREMVKRFFAVEKKLTFATRVRDQLDISPYEALIVASLAEAEAGVPQDIGKIARVAYNRLYGDFPCQCLEFDVGINYYYQLTGRPTKPSKKMTRAEQRDPENPYRLHGKAGLTPTPINNPGEGALRGAMDPPKGDWVFFVAIDADGNSAFAVTDAEHEKNKEIARKAGKI
ncbi:endolytic transglycosylase MltG [Jidongwangia harbinensis]|uniref:endolytic transglycosylase MltG n=1 Tax=Jidongwangia harbinensis TaxID=2878561 RepID=UPI001CD9D0D1|nr:endolytic transglycosylase MltG [Jidongwangia harbinensis]MCA2211758.1 endolytic transglycosylase MltG [Jidongwangia harbinensis]